MQDLQSIVSLFRNKFNKYNNTGARMLDSTNISLKSRFWRKNVKNLSYCYGRHSIALQNL